MWDGNVRIKVRIGTTIPEKVATSIFTTTIEINPTTAVDAATATSTA